MRQKESSGRLERSAPRTILRGNMKGYVRVIEGGGNK